MSGVVFRETLRRNWKAAILMGVMMALMAAYITVIFGNSEMLANMGGMLKSMSFLVDTLGGGDAAFIATPAGMLNYGFFSWMVLLLAGWAVLAGLNVTANEEDRGILDMVLTTPVPRWRLVLEKLLAHTLVIMVSLAIGYVALAVSVGNTAAFAAQLNASRLLECMFNMVPPILLVLAFTALLATLLRRKNTVSTICGVFVIASYFVDMLARSVPDADGLRALSFFKYYDPVNVMKNGLVWGNTLGLLAVTFLMIGGAVWAFRRRDIGL
jgi:ABC-2 type transport system permease protein